MIENGNEFEGKQIDTSPQQSKDVTSSQQDFGFQSGCLDNPQEEKILASDPLELQKCQSVLVNEIIRNQEGNQCQLTLWIDEIEKLQGTLKKILEFFIEIKKKDDHNCFKKNQISQLDAQNNLKVIKDQMEQLMIKCNQLQDMQKMQNITINKLCTFNENYISQAQLSPNDNYVAYSVELKYIKLYSLHSQKLEQQINANNGVTQFQFSNNSQFIYIGCQNGELLIYDIKQLKFINKIHLSNQFLNNIIQIHENLAIVSCNKSLIRLINLNNYKKYFNLKVQSTQKQLLAYDSINKIIINSQIDKSIQFYQINNRKELLSSKNAHDYSLIQIQFINQINQLLTLDLGGLLKLWQVSYGQKQMQELYSFKDQNQIQNFTCKYDLGQLFLLTQQYIKIIDQKQDQNQVIEHNIKQLKILQGNIYTDKSNNFLVLGNKQLLIYQRGLLLDN